MPKVGVDTLISRKELNCINNLVLQPSNQQNDIKNYSLQNIIKVEKLHTEWQDMANNENHGQNIINNRLLHHLHTQYKDALKSDDLWSKMTRDYNLISSSRYTSDEVKILWKQISSMEKRKYELDSFTEDQCGQSDTKSALIKPKKLKKNASSKCLAECKPKKDPSILPEATMRNLQLFGYKTKSNQNDRLPRSTFMEMNPINSTCDQQTQTDRIDDLNDLAREEFQLKISILKVKLNYLERQYQNKFLSNHHHVWSISRCTFIIILQYHWLVVKFTKV